MADRRRPSSWRVPVVLAIAGLLASPGGSPVSHRTGVGDGIIASPAAVAAVSAREALADGADGLREELRRDRVDFTAVAWLRAGDGARSFAAGLHSAASVAFAAADGVILSRMSRSLARRKGGEPS